MKVALLLSGKFRDSFECYNSLIDTLLSKYDVDIFISYFYESPYDVDITMQELIDMYKPKSIIHHQLPKNIHDEIRNSNKLLKYTEVNTENVFSMWYGVKRVNELKKEYEHKNKFKYDIVIRTRFDLKILNEFDLKNRKSSIHIPIGWDHRGGFNDLLAYGDSVSMDYYCELYDKLTKYHDEGNRIHPEKMLKLHLDKSKQILVLRVPLKNSLRGMITSDTEYRCY